MQKPHIIWGGADIDPRFYNMPKSIFAGTFNKHRDEKEWEEIKHYTAMGVPIVGVCRGAQFLCIANGGKLIQHSRPIKQTHPIFTTNTEETILDAPGAHHQIMQPTGTFEVLAVSQTPTQVWLTDEEPTLVDNTPEVLYWPEHKHLAIQHHPEWCGEGSHFIKWLEKTMAQLDIECPFSQSFSWR